MKQTSSGCGSGASAKMAGRVRQEFGLKFSGSLSIATFLCERTATLHPQHSPPTAQNEDPVEGHPRCTDESGVLGHCPVQNVCASYRTGERRWLTISQPEASSHADSCRLPDQSYSSILVSIVVSLLRVCLTSSQHTKSQIHLRNLYRKTLRHHQWFPSLAGYSPVSPRLAQHPI